jgi:energy-coupling factor transporter transmembrane protein EcfT
MMRFFAADVPGKGNMRVVVSWLVALLSWQVILIGLFLPLDFVYQSIIVFVAVTFFCELIAGYFWSDLSREQIFVTASVFFVLLVVLLASTPLGIT